MIYVIRHSADAANRLAPSSPVETHGNGAAVQRALRVLQAHELLHGRVPDYEVFPAVPREHRLSLSELGLPAWAMRVEPELAALQAAEWAVNP